ncbi:MAG: ribonuclease III [Pirellulales bacterium]
MSDPDLSNSAESNAQKVALCQERVGYTFQDFSLAVAALTHASGASSRLDSNERLEFLGDAILGFTICEWLYKQHAEYLEGELTQIKSAVVSRRCCAKVSRRLGLEECLILGKGMRSPSGVPKSLLADVYEALIAAIYLDGGMEPAQEFVLRTMSDELVQAVQGHSIGNYKSALQHLAQRETGAAPYYQLVSEKGPDHDKTFQIVAVLGKTQYTPAWGRNKKDAEQRAAGNALAEMQGLEPPYTALD